MPDNIAVPDTTTTKYATHDDVHLMIGARTASNVTREDLRMSLEAFVRRDTFDAALEGLAEKEHVQDLADRLAKTMAEVATLQIDTANRFTDHDRRINEQKAHLQRYGEMPGIVDNMLSTVESLTQSYHQSSDRIQDLDVNQNNTSARINALELIQSKTQADVTTLTERTDRLFYGDEKANQPGLFDMLKRQNETQQALIEQLNAYQNEIAEQLEPIRVWVENRRSFENWLKRITGKLATVSVAVISSTVIKRVATLLGGTGVGLAVADMLNLFRF